MTALALSLVLASALASAAPQADPAGGPRESHSTSSAPLLVLPRESLSWTTDSFGQVIGATIPSKPLASSVRSIEPTDPPPAPLRVSKEASSLRVIGTSDRGIARDIAVLRWDGPVIVWQRMPVPAAAFGKSLTGLAQWMAESSFTVELDGGSAVRVATESQQVTLAVSAERGKSASVSIAGFPEGAQLRVPAAAPAADGQQPQGQGLVELGRDDMSCRLMIGQDMLLDIDVTRAPPQVRVTVQTPSWLQLERALRELEATDEVLKDAPQDQQAILAPQRAAQQSRVDELRKSAASERAKPTEAPIHACILNPATGREYAAIMISVVEPEPARDGTASPGKARGPALQPRRGAP